MSELDPLAGVEQAAAEKFKQMLEARRAASAGKSVADRPGEAEPPAETGGAKPRLTQALLDEEFGRVAAIIDRAEADLARGTYRNPLDLKANLPKIVGATQLLEKYNFPKELDAAHTRLMAALNERLGEYEVKYNQAMDSAGRTVPPRADTAPAAAGSEPAETPEGRLNIARDLYERAKKRLAGVLEIKTSRSGLMRSVSKASRKKVEKEYTDAEAELRRQKAEYVLAQSENFIETAGKQAEEQFKAYMGYSGREKPSLLRRAWNWAGEASAYNTIWKSNNKDINNWLGRFGARMANLRTGISGGLLLGAAGVAGTSALPAFIAMRAAMGGLGGYIAGSELYRAGSSSIQEKILQNELKKIQDTLSAGRQVSTRRLTQALAQYEFATSLLGKNPANDSKYKELLAAQQRQFKKAFEFSAAKGSGLTQDQKIELINKRLDIKSERVKSALKKQVWKGRGVGVLGALAGVALPLKSLYNSLMAEVPLPDLPAGPELKMPEPLAPVSPTKGGLNIRPQLYPDAPSKLAVDFSGNPPPAKTPFTGVFGKGLSFDQAQPGTGSSVAGAGTETTPIAPPAAEQAAAATAAEQAAAAGGKLAMRAGASLEMKGDSALIQAGQRGIEGALLDLQDAKPEVYDHLLAKLHDKYPDFKGNDGSLVHRFVLDFAKENDYTVDGGGKDLSRIFAAGIEIDLRPEGGINVAVGHEDFMPEKAPTGAGVHAPEGTDTTLSQSASTPDDVDTTAPEPSVEASEPEGAAEAKTVEPETGHRPGTAADRADRAHNATDLERARHGAAFASKDISHGMILEYGQDVYNKFLKQGLNLTKGQLERVSDMTVDDVWNRAAESPKFKQEYRGLLDFLNSGAAIPDKGETVKHFLLHPGQTPEQFLAAKMEAIDKVRIENAENLFYHQGKLSDALRMALKHDYGDFMKNDLRISARSLNQIKDMSMREVSERIQDGRLGKAFRGFAQFVEAALKDRAPDSLEAWNNVGTTVFEYAKRLIQARQKI